MVQDSTDIWFCGFLCGFSTITTTATSTATTTATATAERLFEALRVYCSVILSTDRGSVVLWFIEHSFCGLRFCGSATTTIATDVFYACESSTSGRGLVS